jgi:hypothetical protein
VGWVRRVLVISSVLYRGVAGSDNYIEEPMASEYSTIIQIQKSSTFYSLFFIID